MYKLRKGKKKKRKRNIRAFEKEEVSVKGFDSVYLK